MTTTISRTFTSGAPDLAVPDLSLPEFLLAAGAPNPDRPALVDGPSGRTLSHAELAVAVRQVAAGLAARGLRKGGMNASRLHDQLDHWAARRPQGECAVHADRTTTWRQAAHDANRTANALVRMGLPVGSRVAVLAKNSIEYLLFYYAASKAGVVPS